MVGYIGLYNLHVHEFRKILVIETFHNDKSDVDPSRELSRLNNLFISPLRCSPYKDSYLTLPAASLPNSPSLSASLLSDWLDGKDMLPTDIDEIQKELESNSVLALFQEMEDS